MKKILISILLLMLVLSLNACDDKSKIIDDSSRYQINNNEKKEEIYVRKKMEEYTYGSDELLVWECQYVYDELGRILEIKYPYNEESDSVERMEYDENGFLSKCICDYNLEGNEFLILNYKCDSYGNVLETIPEESSSEMLIDFPSSSYRYDQLHNMLEKNTSYDDGSGIVNSMTYGSRNEILTRNRMFKDKTGALELHYSMKFFYDNNKLDQFSKTFIEKSGREKIIYGKIIYDDNDRMSRISFYDNTWQDLDEYISLEYDENGNLIKEKYFESGEMYKVYEYEYEKIEVNMSDISSAMKWNDELYNPTYSNYFMIY